MLTNFAGLALLKFILHKLLQNREFESTEILLFEDMLLHLCKTIPTICINLTTQSARIIPNDIKIQFILKFFALVLAK